MKPVQLFIVVVCFTTLVVNGALGWWRYYQMSAVVKAFGKLTCGESGLHHATIPGLFLMFQAIGTFVDLLQVMFLVKHQGISQEHEAKENMLHMILSQVLQYVLSAIPLAVVDMEYQRRCICPGPASSEMTVEIIRCLVVGLKLVSFQWILHTAIRERDNGGAGRALQGGNEALVEDEPGCGFCFNRTSSVTVGVFIAFLIGYTGVMAANLIVGSC